MSKIMVVEDDLTLQETIAYNLENEGHTVFTTADGSLALETAREHAPDLIVLDVMLPGLDGLSVCRILRKETTAPIILLTARSGEMDKIIGLDAGADDYITKPFSLGEFLARIRAALRRQQRERPYPVNHLEAAGLRVDIIGRRVQKNGRALSLSHKEFDLLVMLMRNAGAVLSRDLLLTKVWGYDYVGGTRTVDVHIRWLREKIETTPATPRFIQTIRGIGYRFEEAS